MERFLLQCGYRDPDELKKAMEKTKELRSWEFPRLDENIILDIYHVAYYGFSMQEARELIIKSKSLSMNTTFIPI